MKEEYRTGHLYFPLSIRRESNRSIGQVIFTLHLDPKIIKEEYRTGPSLLPTFDLKKIKEEQRTGRLYLPLSIRRESKRSIGQVVFTSHFDPKRIEEEYRTGCLYFPIDPKRIEEE